MALQTAESWVNENVYLRTFPSTLLWQLHIKLSQLFHVAGTWNTAQLLCGAYANYYNMLNDALFKDFRESELPRPTSDIFLFFV